MATEIKKTDKETMRRQMSHVTLNFLLPADPLKNNPVWVQTISGKNQRRTYLRVQSGSFCEKLKKDDFA